jgi:hypothetical protein
MDVNEIDMSNNNQKIAKSIVQKLVDEKLIAADEKQIESKIEQGTIKESDWKIYLESQIRNQNKTKTL